MHSEAGYGNMSSMPCCLRTALQDDGACQEAESSAPAASTWSTAGLTQEPVLWSAKALPRDPRAASSQLTVLFLHVLAVLVGLRGRRCVVVAVTIFSRVHVAVPDVGVFFRGGLVHGRAFTLPSRP